MAPWLFTQWGLDIQRSFPLAKVQKKFFIITCEYFTKWVKVETVATITQKSMEKFLCENIVCQFSVSNWIIINNGPQLKGEKITQFCNNLHIILNSSSISHPQTNREVESANKNILKSLKKRLDEAKGLWVEELSSTLWAIRTTVLSGTRDT